MPTPKPRSDAFDATLTDAQRWQIFDQMRHSPWYTVSEWAAEQFSIPPPSRSALYRWADRMRKDESARRIEQAIIAREEVGNLAAAAGQNDEHLIDAYKALATDIIMSGGNAKEAERLTNMALNLAAAQAKRTELDLKARAQQTKDEALRLAREKFETDAAKKAMEYAAQIKGISADAALDNDAKILAVRQTLFGEVPNG